MMTEDHPMPRADDPGNCVEFVNEDGSVYAWSESNVRYEKVSGMKTGELGSFTLLRRRLAQLEAQARKVVQAKPRDLVREIEGLKLLLPGAAPIPAEEMARRMRTPPPKRGCASFGSPCGNCDDCRTY